MKYMVMVNGKYMTQVNTDRSACGAEHIVLDDLRYGMESALAFDAKSMKTEHFAACFQSCELVSFEELKRMSEAVKADIDRKEEAAQLAYEQIKQQIEELQAKQREAWRELNRIKGERGAAI